MIRLALRFPSGRFHATPWDHHVNEGVVEWPPSPWRILRALVAALHTRCPELDAATAWNALGRLTVPPSFTLPRATVGHSRHYLSQNAVDRRKSALTFDSFVALARDADVIVHWPAETSGAERRAIATMVREVSYLGRAEAWCDMSLLDEQVTTLPANCIPSDGSPAPHSVTMRVLCPNEGFTREAIERTTSDLQREGWSDPPGTRWISYRRSVDALDAIRPASPSGGFAPEEVPGPAVAELAFGGKVLPLLTDAVRVAEQIRAAALSLHETPSATLSGKDADGRPLLDQHRHAHYVPDTRRPDARITHVCVYSPVGFTAQEHRALASISFLKQEHNRPTLDVVLTGVGRPSDFRALSPLFGPSVQWRSRTPFVLPRHVKRQRDRPEEQLVRELELRGFPAPIAIEQVRNARWLEFQTYRKARPHDTGVAGFEMRFAEPQAGPILLGYGCHYGLGQFVEE